MLKISACGGLLAPQANFLRFQTATKGILPYKMSAAGENFVVSERYKGYFMLHKSAPQAKFFRFQSATNGILPYKMSAAGENFAVSERY